MNNYSTEITTAELNDNGLSKNAGWIKVFHVNGESREYLSASMEYLMAGVGLPAHSYADEPELPSAGKALRRNSDGNSWEHVSDYRGQTTYNTETREASTVATLGELPETLTLLAPATAYDLWNGSAWVTDENAKQNAEQVAAQETAQLELNARLTTANARIQTLSDAVELEMATEAESAALVEWKTYRVLLNRLSLENAPDIDWPQVPQE